MPVNTTELISPQRYDELERDGIADLPTILDGQYRSQSGMGLGLLGARRLMDRFEIASKPGQGTRVELGHRLSPRSGRVTLLVAISQRCLYAVSEQSDAFVRGAGVA